MSLLESMRSGTDSTWMQVILAIVVVSFVFWYASPQGDTTAVMANVNGKRIMSTDVERFMRTRFPGSPSSQEEAARRQAAAVTALTEQELLVQQAEAAGVVVDFDKQKGFSRSIALLRRENPNFIDEEGDFDIELYRDWVRAVGYTPDQYESELERQVKIQKLQELLSYGILIPEPMLEEAFREFNTRVNIDYVRIAPSDFEDQVPVDEAVVTEWLANNEPLVETQYRADFDEKYNLPAEVELQMIKLQVTGDGQGIPELRTRLELLRGQVVSAEDGQATMADLAAKWSEDPSTESGGSLGLRATNSLTTTLRTLAEELEVGGVSEIEEGAAHVAFYRVVSKTEAREIPLDEVREDIARDLIRADEAPALAATFAEELRTTWEGGASPYGMIGDAGLTLDSTGLIRGDTRREMDWPPQDLLDAARRMEQGEVTDRVFQTGDVLWVGSVRTREEADLSELEENREVIGAQAARSRQAEFIGAWLEDLKADLEG